MKQTGAILDRVDAEVVVGFGGYIALPAYLAARRAGIPFVVHEANARPGLANRLAARMTKHVFTASPRSHLPTAAPSASRCDRRSATSTGPALRPQARQRFGLRPDRPTLMVTGGSQGAQAINAAVAGAASALAGAGIQVLHIVGPLNEVGLPTTGRPMRRTWRSTSSTRCSTPTPPRTSCCAVAAR